MGWEVFELPSMQISDRGPKAGVSAQTQEGTAQLALFIRFKPFISSPKGINMKLGKWVHLLFGSCTTSRLRKWLRRKTSKEDLSQDVTHDSILVGKRWCLILNWLLPYLIGKGMLWYFNSSIFVHSHLELGLNVVECGGVLKHLGYGPRLTSNRLWNTQI